VSAFTSSITKALASFPLSLVLLWLPHTTKQVPNRLQAFLESSLLRTEPIDGSAVRQEPEKGAIAARRHAAESLERVREVALIGEAGIDRDLRQGQFGVHRFPTGVLEPVTSLVFADGAPEEPAKRGREATFWNVWRSMLGCW
jgi:hypothetical protein